MYACLPSNFTLQLFQANIFYGTHDVEEIVESEQFPDIFNFFNTLGGATALWLGLSMVAVFEWVEWVSRLFYTLVRTILKKMGKLPDWCKPLPDPDLEQLPLENHCKCDCSKGNVRIHVGENEVPSESSQTKNGPNGVKIESRIVACDI